MTDPRERIVPLMTEWMLTGRDINKDITGSDIPQEGGINIQLKDAGGLHKVSR